VIDRQCQPGSLFSCLRADRTASECFARRCQPVPLTRDQDAPPQHLVRQFRQRIDGVIGEPWRGRLVFVRQRDPGCTACISRRSTGAIGRCASE